MMPLGHQTPDDGRPDPPATARDQSMTRYLPAAHDRPPARTVVRCEPARPPIGMIFISRFLLDHTGASDLMAAYGLFSLFLINL